MAHHFIENIQTNPLLSLALGTQNVEAECAKALGNRNDVQIPIPSAADRKTLEEYGVQFGKQVDNVLIEAKLPPGWTLGEPSRYDARRRSILNAEGQEVARIFLKACTYDYYGSTCVVNHCLAK